MADGTDKTGFPGRNATVCGASRSEGSAGEPAEHGADALEVALQLCVQPQHLKDREHLAGAAQGDSEVVPASGRLPAPAAALGDVQDDAIGRPDGLVLEVASPRWPAGRRDPLVDRQGELVGVEVLEGAGARPRRRVPRSRPAPETRSSRARLEHRDSIIGRRSSRTRLDHRASLSASRSSLDRPGSTCTRRLAPQRSSVSWQPTQKGTSGRASSRR